MPSFNQVTIIGNLTRDPELRYTPRGVSVCQFTVAINENWKGEGGETNERCDFINVTAWQKTADAIAEYFTKGRAILVSGKLRQETWEDKETGRKRDRVIVICQSFQFVDSKREEGGEGEPRQRRMRQAAPTPAQAQEPFDGGMPEDDDVPF